MASPWQKAVSRWVSWWVDRTNMFIILYVYRNLINCLISPMPEYRIRSVKFVKYLSFYAHATNQRQLIMADVTGPILILPCACDWCVRVIPVPPLRLCWGGLWWPCPGPCHLVACRYGGPDALRTSEENMNFLKPFTWSHSMMQYMYLYQGRTTRYYSVVV